jgi:hypothetical protein
MASMDWFDDAGDWQWLDDIGGGISDFFGGSSTPNYGQGNNLLQPVQPSPQRQIGPLTEQGNFGGDYGLFQGLGDFYNNNKGWIDPAVQFGGEYYKADQAADQADLYKKRLQPSIDFSNKASARQQAYYDPAAVEAGVGADLDRMQGMLSQQYRRADQPRYASAVDRGTLGASTFARSMATRDAERDANWANVVVPGAYDRYYNRGKQMSNADTATALMLSGNPVLQKEYAQADYRSDPWGNAITNYFNQG